MAVLLPMASPPLDSHEPRHPESRSVVGRSIKTTVPTRSSSGGYTWVWLRDRWVAERAEVRGNVLLPTLAWTGLLGLPGGFLGGLLLGGWVARLLALDTQTGEVVGVLMGAIAGPVATWTIYRRGQPRLVIQDGALHIIQGKREEPIPLQEIEGVRLHTDWPALMLGGGEGHVEIVLKSGGAVQVSWDRFSRQANKLAWLLGVDLATT